MALIRSANRFSAAHRKNQSIAIKEGPRDKVIDGKKLCTKCEKILPIEEFHRCSRRSIGYQSWCGACNNIYHIETYHAYRKADALRMARASQLKKQYGLSLDDYSRLLDSQNGVCAICEKHETIHSNPNGRVDSLRVDHCHASGKVRGLLCSECNFGIAKFKDSVKLMGRAIDYLIHAGGN